MNDGGPAFPLSNSYFSQEGSLKSVDWHSGMTLRDYFADSALHSLLVSGFSDSWAVCTEAAYRLADLMLSEREKLR